MICRHTIHTNLIHCIELGCKTILVNTNSIQCIKLVLRCMIMYYQLDTMYRVLCTPTRYIICFLNTNLIHCITIELVFRLSTNVLTNNKFVCTLEKTYLESDRSVFLDDMMAGGRCCLCGTHPNSVADCLLYF